VVGVRWPHRHGDLSAIRIARFMQDFLQDCTIHAGFSAGLNGLCRISCRIARFIQDFLQDCTIYAGVPAGLHNLCRIS